jgi:hypothetical protein
MAGKLPRISSFISGEYLLNKQLAVDKIPFFVLKQYGGFFHRKMVEKTTI